MRLTVVRILLKVSPRTGSEQTLAKVGDALLFFSLGSNSMPCAAAIFPGFVDQINIITKLQRQVPMRQE